MFFNCIVNVLHSRKSFIQNWTRIFLGILIHLKKMKNHIIVKVTLICKQK